MDVRILFKDGTRKTYNNIKELYNQSTSFKNDKLCLITYNDNRFKPSIFISFKDILCFEVEQVVYGGCIKI